MPNSLNVRIEGAPADLEELRQELFREMGQDVDLRELTSALPGELREPLLIGLVVALGGPAVVTGFVAIVKRWMEHREKLQKQEWEHLEKMEELKLKHREKLLQFALLQQGTPQPIELDVLAIQYGGAT